MATAAAPPPAAPLPAAVPLPLYDLFLDLPHPAASASCPPAFLIGGGTTSSSTNNGSSSTAVAAELGEARSVERIKRFAFPEFDDRLHAQEVAAKEAKLARIPPHFRGGGANLNRHDVYAEKFVPTHHVFALQLASGVRVHGHVRRYLPVHREVIGRRVDVGRRGVRALVMLTRSAGGDKLYASLLKAVCAVSDWQMAPGTAKAISEADGGPPQERLLRTVAAEHGRLCRANFDVSKPQVLNVPHVEFGPSSSTASKFGIVDGMRFVLPSTFLRPHTELDSFSTSSGGTSHLMPLLRCLGVSHVLRLMSALLTERRIVLVSSQPARLSAVASGALSVLAQGDLAWQHVYVPVLPPGLINYVAAPMPYLIGMTRDLARSLTSVPGVGEVLEIDLDDNAMEAHNTANPVSSIPDLLRPAFMADDTRSNPYVSAAEVLAQDLSELLKSEKKELRGETAIQDRIGSAADKANKFVKTAFGKMKEKQRKYLEARGMRSSTGDIEYAGSGEGDEKEDYTPTGVGDGGKKAGKGGVGGGADDYAYGEGYANEPAEFEARIAFGTFFLSLLGDMRWYLSQPAPGATPQLDKEKFIDVRRREGDAEGTPMYPLLNHFVQSQIFEQFAKARVAEVRAKLPVPPDASLFALVSNYHRVHRLDFSVTSVRQTARRIVSAETHPGRFLIGWTENIRKRTMALTSNSPFQGDATQALEHLTNNCRECSAVLTDVMYVIWMRIQDSRGMQWKHALLALHVLRNLLLNGPLSAVTEATDGIDKIRALKSYSETMRSQNSQQVRAAATNVYGLLVDRAKLFSQRRECAERRRLKKSPPVGSLTRMRLAISFKNIHAKFRPAAVAPAPVQAAAVVPTPPPAAPMVASSNVPHAAMASRGPLPQNAPVPAKPSGGYAADLLSFDFSAAAPSPVPEPAVSSATTTLASTGEQKQGQAMDSFDMQGMLSAASSVPGKGKAPMATEIPQGSIPSSQPSTHAHMPGPAPSTTSLKMPLNNCGVAQQQHVKPPVATVNQPPPPHIGAQPPVSAPAPPQQAVRSQVPPNIAAGGVPPTTQHQSARPQQTTPVGTSPYPQQAQPGVPTMPNQAYQQYHQQRGNVPPQHHPQQGQFAGHHQGGSAIPLQDVPPYVAVNPPAHAAAPYLVTPQPHPHFVQQHPAQPAGTVPLQPQQQQQQTRQKPPSFSQFDPFARYQ